MVETFVVSILVGLLIGIFSGLLGVGGGTLMIPIFRLGFGMSAIASTATSLFTIVPTSLAGCVTHIKNKTCVVKIGLLAGLGGAITSPLGVLLATGSPEILIMGTAALIIAYSAITMFKKAIQMPKESHSDLSERAAIARFRKEFRDEEQIAADAAAEKELATFEAGQLQAMEAAQTKVTLKKGIYAAVIGMVAGLASGYVGVGGGFLMVPLFVALLGLTMKKASGTSLIAVVLLAIPGVITQCMHGNVDFMAGIAVAIGSIPGALIGATLIRYIPERKLRFLFGFFLLFAAVVLVCNELGLFS